MTYTVLGVGYTLDAVDDHAFDTLPARLDEAQSLGVEFVELPLFALDLIAGGRVLGARVTAVKRMLAGRGLRYTVHGPLAINLMDAPERLARHQEVLGAALEVSAELGALHYVLHNGIYPQSRSVDAEDLYARQRDLLAAFGAQAETLGLLIVVENLWPGPGEVTALPSRLAREIAAIAHPRIWACLDISHGYINASGRGASFLAEMAALAPYAKHLHIHDSFGRPPAFHSPRRSERLAYGEGDLHLPLGLGDIPWDELMRRLRFPGGAVFNCELAPPYWSQLPAMIERTRQLAAAARTAL